MDDFGRLKNTETQTIYSSAKQMNRFTIATGDLIYNLVSSNAVISSERYAGLIINQNFAMLTRKTDLLDLAYLWFVLNESQTVKHQRHVLMQGSVVPKMPPTVLRQIKLNLPPLEKQRLVGQYYMNFNRYYRLKQQRLELSKKINLQFLDQFS